MHIGNDQFGTFSGKGQSGGSANAGSASSNQGDFTVKLSWHGEVSFLCELDGGTRPPNWVRII
jgi:hypothetical protein